MAYMKVLLVYPNLPLMMSPSIALALFNSILQKQGCEVEIFETTHYSDNHDNRHIRLAELGAVRPNTEKDIFVIQPREKIIPDYLEKIQTFKPDLILMSVLEDVWFMAKQFLEASASLDIPIILGGIFPTAAPEIVLRHPQAQYVALHEGERTIVDAVNAIKNNRSLKEIPGIWWKDDFGLIHRNPLQKLCDITETIPDYTCFDDNRWKRPMGGITWQKAMSMETYRGCPYNCTFCNSPNTRNFAKENDLGNFLRRKPANVIDKEFEILRETHNPDFIMFQDDSFLARPDREIFEFCEIWSKHCTPFWFNTRIENCKPETLQALRDVGLFRMTFGIESGNDEYRMKVLDRPVKKETYYQHFDIINDSNIPYSLNVIIGMPLETREMVLDSARMIKRAAGYDGIMVAMFQPYHGTYLRDLAVKHGFMDPHYINGDEPKLAGYLDTWSLKMPEPYLQLSDVKGLVKNFVLYAYYPESMWPEIEKAETDDDLYQSLLTQYRQEFLTDYQIGGHDRLEKIFCAQHDPTSTYYFQSVDK